MKRKIIKMLSVALTSALICSAAVNASSVETYEEKENTKSTVAEKTSVTLTTTEGLSAKEETVYIIAEADGSVRDVIVSDWLKNPDGDAKIEDNSILEDIVNVKGDETFTQNGEKLVWSAGGNDIYYRGTTDKEPPVRVSVSFKLDGQDISPTELAGKSGKVTIRIDYQNTVYSYVDIEGSKEKIAVPFVMLTGMVLENEHFSNIEVTNGKLINDGDRSFVMGVAFPGLQESLDVGSDIIQIPNYIEITADTTDFKLGGTVTLATNQFFKDFSIDSEDSLDSLYDKLDQLNEAMGKLCDGSSELYDGIEELLEKSYALVSGIEELYDGTKELKSGVSVLSDGASELDEGTKQLAEGLSELSENSDTLKAGAKQVFESLLSQAYEQLVAAGISVDKLTIENYFEILDLTLQSLDKDKVYDLAYQAAKAKVEEAVTAQSDYIKTQITLGVKQKVTEEVLSAVGINMSIDEYQAAVEAGIVTQEVQQQIEAAVEAQMATDTVQSTIEQMLNEQIAALIDENMKSEEVVSQIEAAVTKAEEGAKSIIALKEQLDSLNTFYQGVIAYTDAVDSAANGAKQVYEGADALSNGVDDLKEGAEMLFDGIGQLKDNSGLLIDGVKQLSDGAKILTDGLNEFNKEGIQKLTDTLKGDIDNLTNRLEAIKDAANSYNNFSGISTETEGNVRFVYKTLPID